MLPSKASGKLLDVDVLDDVSRDAADSTTATPGAERVHMTLSVVICTWNRATLLERALTSIASAEPPTVAWEVIVVNNNCTDGTEHVIERFTSRLPIKRVFEPTPGLSNARNAAIAVAQGHYLIWTDDDVLVSADWVIAYERAFKRWPDAAFFGGPIRPCFEGTPPRWLSSSWKE